MGEEHIVGSKPGTPDQLPAGGGREAGVDLREIRDAAPHVERRIAEHRAEELAACAARDQRELAFDQS